HHAVRAQPWQDRAGEAGPGRELRVYVQRVAVAAQPVPQRLSRPGRGLQHRIRFTFRDGHAGRLAPLAAEAALTPYKNACSVGEQRLAGRVDGAGLHDDDRGAALVLYVGDDRPGLRLAVDRQRPVDGQLLPAVQGSREVDVDA